MRQKFSKWLKQCATRERKTQKTKGNKENEADMRFSTFSSTGSFKLSFSPCSSLPLSRSIPYSPPVPFISDVDGTGEFGRRERETPKNNVFFI
jgi:hypothetical protein